MFNKATPSSTSKRLVFFLAPMVCVLMHACESKKPVSPLHVPAFDKQNAFTHLTNQVDFGARVPGSERGAEVSSSFQFNIDMSNAPIMGATQPLEKYLAALRYGICCMAASSGAGEAPDGVLHWQASQPGSSMAQNLMSDAGASCTACSAPLACAASVRPLIALTALSLPDCTVDFSACVALVVRR